MLFRDAVAETGVPVNLHMLDDGEVLMKHLLDSGVTLPDLLFLDLNMPIKNGFQCLEEIRATPFLHDLVVIIYSTTASPRDVDQVYDKGASLFVKKPNSFKVLRHTLSQIFTLNRKEYFASIQKENFVFESYGVLQ